MCRMALTLNPMILRLQWLRHWTDDKEDVLYVPEPPESLVEQDCPELFDLLDEYEIPSNKTVLLAHSRPDDIGVHSGQ